MTSTHGWIVAVVVALLATFVSTVWPGWPLVAVLVGATGTQLGRIWVQISVPDMTPPAWPWTGETIIAWGPVLVILAMWLQGKPIEGWAVVGSVVHAWAGMLCFAVGVMVAGPSAAVKQQADRMTTLSAAHAERKPRRHHTPPEQIRARYAEMAALRSNSLSEKPCGSASDRRAAV